MTAGERKRWDDLVVDVGRLAGRVVCGERELRLELARAGCAVTVPAATFDRLVAEGRLAADGTVVEAAS